MIPATQAATLFLLVPNPQAAHRAFEFFTARIRNPHTRRAYWTAVRQFSTWCERRHLMLEAVQAAHVAAWIEELGRDHAKPTVKQRLAAVRMLFDWLVVTQVIPLNPADPVRGPRYSARKGKTPVLLPEEMRALLDSLDTGVLLDTRDRALLGLMAYTFARVGAVVQMTVGDYFIQGRRGWVRLQEKGGKVNEMPCHHNLERYLDDWLRASGMTAAESMSLFPTFRQGLPTGRPLPPANVHAMIQRRAKAAGIETHIGCHTFRATGITTYLEHGGRLEIAQQMAGHESPQTTRLYDRRSDRIALDEIERIAY